MQRISRCWIRPINSSQVKSERLFPDRQYAVEETFAQGEKVVIRIIMTATHQGMFVGNPPTGRTVKATQFREFRVVDGKIAEHRGWFDTGSLLPQIKTNS
ncbi:ester cyclase [Paenibacillus sp. P26]|nr:ester cyclase [Paenibacillus sp. P26]